jgi:molybdopterin-guanine dinucleotide biosynthesis protein A
MTPDAPFTLAGVVLAAGRSSRMGTDKALLSLDGQPLWRRQYELLAAAGVDMERLLSVRPEQTWAPVEIRRVVDAIPEGGPLGGIIAAMAASTSTHLVVLAVDLPRLPPAWFAQLRLRLEPRAGAVGQRDDGLFEPLAAIYPRAMAGLMVEEFSAGRQSLQSVVKRALASGMLHVQSIDADKSRWFENWNAPEEVKRSSRLQ